jgi:CRP-like cAMP-binding protein
LNNYFYVPIQPMSELLQKSIRKIIDISNEEFSICKSLFTPHNIKRKHYLLQQGQICKNLAFVEKGILKSYLVNHNGNENILQFAFEGWWMADLASFLTGEPCDLDIDAIEDTELLLITKSSWDDLILRVPKFERYFRILVENSLVATQKRLLHSISQPAEKRYLNFLATYPGCLEKVPQYMVASYLGITRETLSRLRKQIAVKKA